MGESKDRKQRVLIVDDEPGMGKLLGIKLRLCNYDVITTTSGEEAIRLVRTEAPDVVLLDILMPGVTGFDVLERVRAFSQIPIIVFTARPDVFKMAMSLGANDFVAKPFNPDHLVEKIRLVSTNERHRKPANGAAA